LLKPEAEHTMSQPSSPRAHCQRGFALLEVMVALLICSAGILGIVGLQATMTRAQTSTAFRGEAAYLAQQLIGGMWADHSSLAGYATGSSTCSAACLDWQSRIASRLPGGTGSVTVDSVTGLVTIEIRWTAPGESTPSRFKTATVITNS
jgi:type IV pilus assembly protein PilV